MKNNLKNLIMCILFVALITGFFVSGLIIPDAELSYSERRTLKKLPELTTDSLLSGKYFKDFEAYVPDHFPLRDQLRTVKAVSHFFVFNMRDNDGIFIIDNSAFKLLYPMNERSVRDAAEKLNSLYDTYLQGMSVYYSVVPDKNYYSAAQKNYPVIDYERLVEIMNSGTRNMEYINLFDCIDADGFYKTDPHWKQEKLGPVVARLAEKMGFDYLPIESYERETLYPFYGAYYRQSALPLLPDNLTYLTSGTLRSATVRNFNAPDRISPVYESDLFGGMDSYDVYLGGATPITIIENQNATTDKELILFRDSSGSSLAPLLLEGYKKITLVDLRYISSSLLGKYIDFKNQDVLFLYNVHVLNNSMMLK